MYFCIVADDTLPDLNDLAGLTQVSREKPPVPTSSSSSDFIIVDDDDWNHKPLYSEVLKGASLKLEKNET